ncbi:MAG: precorrin-6A reductase [Sphaerochaeta sp.]
MFDVLIFGGTTEARLLVSALLDHEIRCKVSVTSDYARSLMPDSPLLTVSVKRLDEGEIEDMLLRCNPSLIVDATHLYATEVSKNIKRVCQKLDREFLTLIREVGGVEGATLFDSIDEMVDFLNENCTESDAIFSTLGIKEAKLFKEKLPSYRSNVYLRILPSMESLRSACELGFPSKHIICMMGPFSKEMNVAFLHECRAKYLLTKITGKFGGLDSKIEAARECGVEVLAIRAPKRENGLNLEEMKSLIEQRALEEL